MTNKQSIGDNKNGLPHGTGSIHYRGQKWWIVYRNADNVQIQESTYTDDLGAARRILAKKAIQTLQARIRRLKEVANAPDKSVDPGSAPAKGSRRG